MLEYLRGLPNVGKYNLPESFKNDLKWWHSFVPLYNGVSMMAIEEWSSPDEIFASDACLTGCGTWYTKGMEYFDTEFLSFISDLDLSINAQEMLSVVVCAKYGGDIGAV